MLDYYAGQKIMLGIEPVDFRKGAQRLIALCQHELSVIPECGIWFVFTNKRRIAIKVLSIDSTGYWLATKYFARGRLAFWPSSHSSVTTVSALQLELIVAQKHPVTAEYIGKLGASSRLFDN